MNICSFKILNLYRRNLNIKNTMIAIPASENNINALIDDRFGRCPFFCFYNEDTGKSEFRVNLIRSDAGGVGPKVAEFLAISGVNKVYATEFGPKAKDVLDKLKIETQMAKKGKKVREIIENL